MTSKPAAILLSGGASRRMGRPKATLPIGAETFLSRLVRIFTPSCHPVVVVLGRGHAAEEIQAAHAGLPVRFLVNPEPERGMFSSLQTGLAAIDPGVPVLFQPVDYPAVEESTVRQLAGIDALLAIPTYGEQHGHPVRLGAALVEELKRADPGSQARHLLRPHYPEAAFLPVDDPGIVHDIDTPEEYARWLA